MTYKVLINTANEQSSSLHPISFYGCKSNYKLEFFISFREIVLTMYWAEKKSILSVLLQKILVKEHYIIQQRRIEFFDHVVVSLFQ